ncbi:MAG: hypothetical protein IT449_05535 [Phycisphaerales bacterium]|nr:hypothetical protein [Phycisphaerales bacterium]
MIQRIALIVLVCSTAAPSQEAVCPEATTYTWLGGNENWFLNTNWSPNGVPGSDDIAYIPSVDLQNQKFFPIISSGHAAVCALVMEKTDEEAETGPTLTLQWASGTAWNLNVGGQNGLIVGPDCEIRLEKDMTLNLLSPGTVQLDGSIVFKSSLPDKRPTINFPTGATILKGGGHILGEQLGRLWSTAGYQSQSWVVVGPDNALHGEFHIDVGLINNGVVDPVGGLSEGQGITQRAIYLTCTPKMGSGQWNITGGTADINHAIYVNVDLTGTGRIKVGNYGILYVNRHISLGGGFTMEGNGKYIVPRLTLFDAHRFVKVCDFSGS